MKSSEDRPQDERPVPSWDGRLSRALRQAMRLSLRDFAKQLGVTDRMVSKWEQAGERVRPRPFSQQLLDTMLSRAGGDAQARFFMAMHALPIEGTSVNQIEVIGADERVAADSAEQLEVLMAAVVTTLAAHQPNGDKCPACEVPWPCFPVEASSQRLVRCLTNILRNARG